jgi:hypothetical protein
LVDAGIETRTVAEFSMSAACLHFTLTLQGTV